MKPILECQALDIKNLPEFIRVHALEAEQNTMGTLPDTMMLTGLLHSTEYTLGFRAQILNESHLQACPGC
jgi:hypothetical protein